MPEANKVVAATVTKAIESVKPAATPATKTVKVADIVGPMDDAEVVDGINALLAEWSEQNQGVAKVDLQLGAFRTILQTARIPAE